MKANKKLERVPMEIILETLRKFLDKLIGRAVSIYQYGNVCLPFYIEKFDYGIEEQNGKIMLLLIDDFQDETVDVEIITVDDIENSKGMNDYVITLHMNNGINLQLFTY
jgi:hypothetical protein